MIKICIPKQVLSNLNMMKYGTEWNCVEKCRHDKRDLKLQGMTRFIAYICNGNNVNFRYCT